MAARDDYDTALSAAVTAFEAGSFATARSKVRVARMHLARIVDESGAVDGASFKARALSELDSILEDVNAAEARSSVGITYSQWVP